MKKIPAILFFITALFLAAPVFAATAFWQAVGISEFMATNQSTVLDEDSNASPWIEIFNPTTSDVNLNGWSLTDDPDNLTQWRFPNVTIPDADDANGSDNYIVVFASGKNRTSNTNELHTNFRLPVNGGYLALVDPNTNIVSVFNAYPAQQPDVSYGRDVINPNIVGYFPNPTPGDLNTIGGTNFSPAVIFSRAGSTFVTSFNLQLSTSNANAVIHYTLDGSVPTEASAAYSAPLSITGSVQVRARAFDDADGLMPGSLLAKVIFNWPRASSTPTRIYRRWSFTILTEATCRLTIVWAQRINLLICPSTNRRMETLR